RPLSDQVSDSLARDRVLTMLAGFFGVLALLLAAIGVYGVTAYALSRRRTELGVRAALGATPASLIALVMSKATALVGTGVTIGAVMSLATSTVAASLLYGLQPRDPMTMAEAAAGLAAVGMLAAWLPARHAAGVDPAAVLRDT